jgi:hypothetical protein
MRGVTAADVAAVAAPDAYNKLISRKQFSGQWHYGVATFLPGEPAPYVYQITYHDGNDQELMILSTVRRNAVRSWQDIPAFVREAQTLSPGAAVLLEGFALLLGRQVGSRGDRRPHLPHCLHPAPPASISPPDHFSIAPAC